MKRIVLALSFLSIAFISFGQIENPVSWNYEAKKKSADTYEIVITASIESPWHIYSQSTGKGGPIPTSVSFKANPLITKNGAVKEIGKLETNISGTIEYMVCDDSHCLPPSKKSFDLKLQ